MHARVTRFKGEPARIDEAIRMIKEKVMSEEAATKLREQATAAGAGQITGVERYEVFAQA